MAGQPAFFISMLKIYSNKTTARLEYVCHFILKEQLGLDYLIINNSRELNFNEDVIINYSENKIESSVFTIFPNSLLFENAINQQQIRCVEFRSFESGKKQVTAFFDCENSDFPFDIFAASFYLLSRYEEYLPFVKDTYGRFHHENALAFKNGFLQKPLINIWIEEFKMALKSKFPQLIFNTPQFKTILSYDIDIAWSYKNKGLIRNIGGFLKNTDWERFKVMLGFKKDPFDAYEFMDSIHQHIKSEIIYFFLVAKSVSRYDKNVSPRNHSMRNLIKAHSEKYNIGLHPSWKSSNYLNILNYEKNRLEKIAHKSISISRQHYIQFSLPATFENLIKAGINKDFSMGYGSINGFRASFAGSFFWYNLKEEKVTSLRLYPFCFMDANSYYEQKQNAAESLSEINHYKNECEKVNGLFISIFHNNFLGTDPQFKGWKEMYVNFISQLQ